MPPPLVTKIRHFKILHTLMELSEYQREVDDSKYKYKSKPFTNCVDGIIKITIEQKVKYQEYNFKVLFAAILLNNYDQVETN